MYRAGYEVLQGGAQRALRRPEAALGQPLPALHVRAQPRRHPRQPACARGHAALSRRAGAFRVRLPDRWVPVSGAVDRPGAAVAADTRGYGGIAGVGAPTDGARPRRVEFARWSNWQKLGALPPYREAVHETHQGSARC